MDEGMYDGVVGEGRDVKKYDKYVLSLLAKGVLGVKDDGRKQIIRQRTVPPI